MNKLIVAAPVLSGIFWGATGIFVRHLADEGLSSVTIMFTRVLVAAVIRCV